MFFKINVPAGEALLRVEISGGTGDADLYVKKGEKPTAKSWDYAPYLHGNNEVVEVQDPAAAAWYIMIRGYQAYAGLTLKACFHAEKDDCDDCVIIIW
jgi:serine protease